MHFVLVTSKRFPLVHRLCIIFVSLRATPCLLRAYVHVVICAKVAESLVLSVSGGVFSFVSCYCLSLVTSLSAQLRSTSYLFRISQAVCAAQHLIFRPCNARFLHLALDRAAEATISTGSSGN